MKTYKDLDVWKTAMALTSEVYRITKDYPSDERFGLISQTRRAAVSIPSNIAEGTGRNYKKDTIQFQYVARGSIYELQTLLEIACSVGMIDNETLIDLASMIEKNLKLLNGFITYLENANLK